MNVRTEQSGQRVLVVGAGMAGVQTAVQLREQGWPGEIAVIGAEPHQPYDRPPLSKAVLLGKDTGSAFDVDFGALGVELNLGRRATGLRTDHRTVHTDAGPVPYDHLVIATGAEPVLLPGTEHVPGVHPLRTLDDAGQLRPVLTERRDVVVVGAGWIGAEFTTAAREAGCRVTVVEAADQPLAGVLPPRVAVHLRRWYAEAGVELRTGHAVTAVRPGRRTEAPEGVRRPEPLCEVELSDGSVLPAGAVVVGIGARPATDWLAGSGVALAEDRSVLADERLRTTAPDVYAVGDCASFPSPRYGRRLLVHHWDNALQGPRTVAAGLAGDTAVAPVYDPVPYFWSEQF
ncbi:MAG TPA: NAD(P)/FAD-dependent oxidoreductase, partial [Streptomyces sp.]|nr:NAD(P)/FAD-dependent oxidoreductase [Streptomyces sp.]